jgi:hypothetical protein
VRVQPGTGAAAHDPTGAEAKVRDLPAGWTRGTDPVIDGMVLPNVNLPDASASVTCLDLVSKLRRHLIWGCCGSQDPA